MQISALRSAIVAVVRIAGYLVVTSAGFADEIEQGPKDSPPSGLLAGVARADITPPVGIVHLNWGAQTHIEAVGIDPLGMWATALVVSNGEKRFAMVDVDAINIEGLEPAIERAARVTGIPAAHIRIGASHTHAGPWLSRIRGPLVKDLAEQEQMVEHHRQQTIAKIVGAIVEANSKLRPVHVYGGRGEGTININRRVRAREGYPPSVGRNPDEFVDRELVVVRIDDAEGKPYAAIVNFQCHGTVLAHENRQISPDWIGKVRKVVEEALPGALCLFFQGAAGNQGPIEGFTGDLSVPHRLGAILGHQAAAVALSVETVRRAPKFEGYTESVAYLAKQPWRVKGPRNGVLRFASRVIELPPRLYSSEEIAAKNAEVAAAEEKLRELPDDATPWQKHQAEAGLRRLRNLVKQWAEVQDPKRVPFRVQILRIGDVAIVAMPGEPFAEIGAAVKKASPFDVTLFCAYSTGEGGDYVPTGAEFPHGGYEVERTPYGVTASEELIRETIALFDEVK